jgi:hypothetical protein
MYIKILERTILDAIIEFLDEHNIETSDIKQRQTTILNSGVIVHGGNVTAETLAVGEGSKATTWRTLESNTKDINISRKGE